MQVKKQLLHLIIAILSTFLSTAAVAQGYPPVKDTLSGVAFSRMVEQSLSSYYAELASNGSTDSIVDALAYEARAIPQFKGYEAGKRFAKRKEIPSFVFERNTVPEFITRKLWNRSGF